MKKLISLFTALFLLMSALPAQAESPEISDLLTEYYLSLIHISEPTRPY